MRQRYYKLGKSYVLFVFVIALTFCSKFCCILQFREGQSLVNNLWLIASVIFPCSFYLFKGTSVGPLTFPDRNFNGSTSRALNVVCVRKRYCQEMLGAQQTLLYRIPKFKVYNASIINIHSSMTVYGRLENTMYDIRSWDRPHPMSKIS